jgi:uncharacterized membrane protein
MRVLGHPVHTMLLHFPVALWPAHWALHVFAARLPASAGLVAFWLLVAGTGIGWLAAFCGAADLLGVWREGDAGRLTKGIIHGSVNGCVLACFTCVVAGEYSVYPSIAHGSALLSFEGALLAAMFVGNYFGGALVWRNPPA